LKGSLDQIDGVIYFDSGVVPSGGEIADNTSEMAGRNLRRWDVSVQNLAEDVERVAANISDEFPVR
jgi:COP9 signalosome complex subunit 4